MNEENNEELNGQSQSFTVQNNQSNMTQQASKQVANRVLSSKESKKALRSLLKTLGPILIKVGMVLIALIIIIGIIMFVVSMPGMAMEKLKEILKKAGDSIAAFFGADTTSMIEDEEIYETLDYLRNMGYELKDMRIFDRIYDR